MSTYIPRTEVDHIVDLSAEAIRTFLANAHPDAHDQEAKSCILEFRCNPTQFTTERMVELGKDPFKAIQYSVRIEVRNLNAHGAAQVVAKGLWGQERMRAVDIMRNDLKGRANVHIAGSSSFEFNKIGVDKALPIRFARAHWDAILDEIGYAPGRFINSKKTATVIAADGDSTLYEGPKQDKPLPTVAMSPARDALIAYLEAGGVFMLVSGNDQDRTVYRLKDGIPAHLFNRLLIVSNGGADLVRLDAQGYVHPINGYVETPLHMADSRELDIAYIGDDGNPNGNDWAAFQEVGLHRSVLVAKEFKNDYNAQLKSVHAGGLILGTKLFLERATLFAHNNPNQALFSRFHGGMYGEC